MNIYYHHVGEKGAKEDFPKTVYTRQSISLVKDSVPSDNPNKVEWIEQLYREFPSGRFNCWGVPSGARSVIRRIQKGDAVLLVESAQWARGDIPAIGQVRVFFQQELPNLSNALWGDPRYPYVFFFNTERLVLSWIEFLDHVGYSENFNPRGMFYRVQKGRLEKFGGPGGYLNFLRANYRVTGQKLIEYSKDELKHLIKEGKPEYIDGVVSELEGMIIAAESTAPKLKDDSDPEENSSKIRLRSEAFRYGVRKLYKESCAVCGLSARTPDDNPEVESSHIFPKAKMGSDDLRNGIALCRFHHWAFDCGWFSINDDYKVIVRDNIPDTDDYIEIRKHNGKTIHLPPSKFLRPHPIFLEAHRKIHGFK